MFILATRNLRKIPCFSCWLREHTHSQAIKRISRTKQQRTQRRDCCSLFVVRLQLFGVTQRSSLQVQTNCYII